MGRYSDLKTSTALGRMVNKIVRFIERRIHPRYEVNASVSFDLVDKESSLPVMKPHRAMMTDMSKTGCSLVVERVIFNGFYLLKCLEDEGKYAVHITLHDSEVLDASVELTGQLRWIGNIGEPSEHRYKVGITLVPAIDAKIFSRLKGVLSIQTGRDDGGGSVAAL